MKKAGGVLAIIGGTVGIVESVALILSAAIGMRFDSEYSILNFVMGWVGLVFSLALVLLGSLFLKSSKRLHALQSLVCASIGVILATCVFVPMMLFGSTYDQNPSRLISTGYTLQTIGVLWASGWYIGIFLVLGVVGGILATIGTPKLEPAPDDATSEPQSDSNVS